MIKEETNINNFNFKRKLIAMSNLLRSKYTHIINKMKE